MTIDYRSYNISEGISNKMESRYVISNNNLIISWIPIKCAYNERCLYNLSAFYEQLYYETLLLTLLSARITHPPIFMRIEIFSI